MRKPGYYASVAIRYALALVLLLAGVAKGVDLVRGVDGSLLLGALSVFEVSLAVWLVSGQSSLAVATVGVFGFLTVAHGAARVVGGSELQAPCGCLGSVVPLVMWQQLLISGGLLVGAGLLTILVRGGTSR